MALCMRDGVVQEEERASCIDSLCPRTKDTNIHRPHCLRMRMLLPMREKAREQLTLTPMDTLKSIFLPMPMLLVAAQGLH